MYSHDICLLLVISCLAASEAIRVDWGTNTGPIVPPTPRTTPVPTLPYREPAPVWEDQSDDIPNPNAYVYVLPPPSRPRTWPIPIGPYDDRGYSQPNRNYGAVLTPQQAQAQSQAQSQGYYNGGATVAALAAQYIPGVGYRYAAVVPKSQKNGITDKLQGKYNAKTKKYKAYEKAKFTPLNYYRLFDVDAHYVPQGMQQQLLPFKDQPLDWQAAATTVPSSNTTTTSSSPSTTAHTTTVATTASTVAATAVPQPPATTTSGKLLIGNYKLAHEKSSYVKPWQHTKKKQQQQLKAQKLATLESQNQTT